MFFILKLFDLLFYVVVIVFRFLVLRLQLEGLLVVLESICPVTELFVVTLLCFAALIKCVAKVIMPLALQTDIPREQCLAK